MNHLPLSHFEDDKLSFNETSKTIADFINNFPNDQPYSIAIYGNWGSGKSTMLNFIENDLDETNVILKFNPWEILNEENLVPTLFEEIAFSIGKAKYKKLKEKLLSYGRKICSTGTKVASRSLLQLKGIDDESSGIIADFNSGIVESLFDSNSPKPLSEKKRELEKELKNWSKKENKKLVVFIDEVDRLFPSEIVEIFKIIKATISFPGILFVVAMDKISVMDSLKSINISRPEEYLIKLFQQRYYIDSEFQLQTLYKELLIPTLNHIDKDAYQSLITAINACILFKKEDQYYLQEKETQKEELRSTYYNIYHELRKNLSIPRNFINYSFYLKANWEIFFSSVKDENFEEKRDDIILFLILTLAYIYPQTIRMDIIGSRFINKNELDGNPEIVKFVRVGLLNKFFESSRVSSNTNPQQYRDIYYDSIIEKIIQLIKKYPDYNNNK